MTTQKTLDSILKLCDRIKKEVNDCKDEIKAIKHKDGSQILFNIDSSLSQLLTRLNSPGTLVSLKKNNSELSLLCLDPSPRHQPVTTHKTVALISVRRKSDNDTSWSPEEETYVSSTRPHSERITRPSSITDFQETRVDEEHENTDVESAGSFDAVGGRKPNISKDEVEARGTDDNDTERYNSKPTERSRNDDIDSGNNQYNLPEGITTGDSRHGLNDLNDGPRVQRKSGSESKTNTQNNQDNLPQGNTSMDTRHEPKTVNNESTEDNKSGIESRTGIQDSQICERPESERSDRMRTSIEGTIYKHENVIITKLGDTTHHIEGCKGRGGIVCFDEYFVIVAKDKLLKINIDDGEVKSEIICDDALCLCKLRTTNKRAGVLTGRFIKIINTETSLEVVYQIEISANYQHICHAATYEKYPDNDKPDPSFYFYVVRTVQCGPTEYREKLYKICANRERIPSTSVRNRFTEQQKEIELPTHVTIGIRCIEALSENKVIIATQTGIHCVINTEKQPQWVVAWSIDHQINSMFRYHKSLYLCFPTAMEKRVMKVDRDGHILSENLISGYQGVVPDYVDVHNNVLFIAGFDTTEWKIHLHRFAKS